MSENTPSIGRPEPPPPRPVMMFATLCLAFQVATVVVLVGERGDIAIILAVLALVFGAATLFTLVGWSNAAGDYNRALDLQAEERAKAGRGTTAQPGVTPPVDRGPHGPAGR